MSQKPLRPKPYWAILVFLLLFIPLSLGLYVSQCCQEISASSENSLAAITETATANPTAIGVTILLTETMPPISPTASATPIPTITATKTQAASTTIHSATDQPKPEAIAVNGLFPEDFIHLPAKTRHHSLEILARGKAAGRNLNRFSRVGDSILDTEQFFTVFDNGRYQLGDYQYLDNVIQQYRGVFSRVGVAAENGWSAATVLSPKWANDEYCYANETPLACEIRLNNPSLILIHFGTNDAASSYENNMRRIIEYAIGKGVVPVLITKANRVDEKNQRNEVLYKLADEYYIPLWDFDAVADTLPNRGLAEDKMHLTLAYDFDYSDSPKLFYGYEALNLSGLLFLDAFLRDVVFYDR
jgi:hypothetical protein